MSLKSSDKLQLQNSTINNRYKYKYRLLSRTLNRMEGLRLLTSLKHDWVCMLSAKVASKSFRIKFRAPQKE